MQESIFDLFGSRHATAQKHNSRQATSVSSANSLGLAGRPTENFKQKSLSVGGPTPFKRALGDVSNRVQKSRPLPGKEPAPYSCQQKSPSFSNSSKTLPQKLCQKSDECGLKNTTPTMKNLNRPMTSVEVSSNPAIDWNGKPEIFPDAEITEIEDEFEDLFPKRERLTNEDIYRVVTSFGKAEEPEPLITSPDIIPLLPLPDVAVEYMQSLEVDLFSDIADEHVSLPDLLWETEGKDYRNEGFFRHTL